MYSNSKDNGFCNSATPISGIFEGIDFLKDTTVLRIPPLESLESGLLKLFLGQT